MANAKSSNIQEFYFNRSIFITGATGFMGKVLVEKLLRSCEGIARVYLLIRPSRGKDANARLDELLNCTIFEWLKQNRPETLSKLIAVSGDVSLPELGISPSDMLEIKENVTVVFHSAARVKFDEDLRSAIESNVKGPKLVAAFCQQLKNIEAFVHVSTTFNNLDRKEITEEVFPATTDPHKLIDFIDSTEDSLLANLVKPLIGKCPNVYAYSKALGEQLLQKECNAHGIPLIIVRPSTVGAAMEEPIPGWVDNMNGASGIIVGVGKGIIRSIKINVDLVTDLIPVDFPINLMISAAWDRATSNNAITNVPVYNCSTGTINPLTWREFVRYGFPSVLESPFKEIVWYPGAMFTTNKILFKIGVVLYHYLPAYVLDMVARLTGRKPFLVGLYKKVDKAMSCLEFYTMNQWNFVSRNPVQLMKRMTDEDRENFNFDVTKINWESYMETYVNGVRTFVVKDDPKDLPKARKHLKRMKNVGSAIRFFLLLLFFALLFSLLQCMHLYSIDMATNNGTITAIELAKQEMLKVPLQIIPPFANYK